MHCHSCDLCLKTGKSLSTAECLCVYAEHVLLCSVGAGVHFLNLFIFNGRGTDCSFHSVLKCQEWESVDDTKDTISINTHKHDEGEQGSTVQASTASSGQTASELLSCE